MDTPTTNQYTLSVTLSRTTSLVRACAVLDIELRSARVYLSNPQRFTVVEHFDGGHTTVIDESDRSAHFFPTLADASDFIGWSELWVRPTPRKYSVKTTVRVSPSKTEHKPIYHVSDPAEIDWPLTSDFHAGVYDSQIDDLNVGEYRVFIPQAAQHDTHILDGFTDLSRDLRTSIVVRRVS